MESLRYHDLENILVHCATGRINMHEPIEVMNQSQTMKTEMTVLKHLVVLSKTEKVSLIHILSRLRCSLKEQLEKLIEENAFVKHYVVNVIKEWRLDISTSDLLNDGLDNCNYEKGDLFPYEKLVEELECSQRGGSKLDEIERILRERQEKHKPMTPDYSKQMKIKLSDLLNECTECSSRVKSQSVDAQTTYRSMDPKHLQVLIDLSFKPKSSYLEFSNQFRDTNHIFAVFLSETHDIEIPDTIHTMFLNYLLTVNMIKKEMNYINNSLKQIVVYMDPKLETLGKLVKSFTLLDPEEDVIDTVHEPMDGEGLQENIVIKDDSMIDPQEVIDSIKDSIKDKFTFF
jgi:hypothetical protein